MNIAELTTKTSGLDFSDTEGFWDYFSINVPFFVLGILGIFLVVFLIGKMIFLSDSFEFADFVFGIVLAIIGSLIMTLLIGAAQVKNHKQDVNSNFISSVENEYNIEFSNSDKVNIIKIEDKKSTLVTVYFTTAKNPNIQIKGKLQIKNLSSKSYHATLYVNSKTQDKTNLVEYNSISENKTNTKEELKEAE